MSEEFLLALYPIIKAVADFFGPQGLSMIGQGIGYLLYIGIFALIVFAAVAIARIILTKIPSWALVLLGLSPAGAFIPYLLFSVVGVCRGGLGSGISCEIPVIGEYLAGVAAWTEVSMMMLIGIVWVALAFGIWGLLIVRLIRPLSRYFTKRQSV